MNRADELRKQILNLFSEYAREAFPSQKKFMAGESPVPVSGRVFDDRDVKSLVDSSLDFWLTAGRFAEEFERKFARHFGVRSARLVNSGPCDELRQHLLDLVAEYVNVAFASELTARRHTAWNHGHDVPGLIRDKIGCIHFTYRRWTRGRATSLEPIRDVKLLIGNLISQG